MSNEVFHDDGNTPKLRRSKRRNKYHLDVAAMLSGNNPDRRLSPPPVGVKNNNNNNSQRIQLQIGTANATTEIKIIPTTTIFSNNIKILSSQKPCTSIMPNISSTFASQATISSLKKDIMMVEKKANIQILTTEAAVLTNIDELNAIEQNKIYNEKSSLLKDMPIILPQGNCCKIK